MRDTGASFGSAIAAGAFVLAVIDDHAFGSVVVTVAAPAATAGLAPLHLPCHF